MHTGSGLGIFYQMACAGAGAQDIEDAGFARPEMFSQSLAGTVDR